MDTKNIDEAENLICKYRQVMDAKEKIAIIEGEDGGPDDSFSLVDKATGVEICLYGMKQDALDEIGNVLNDKYDKITARLREI